MRNLFLAALIAVVASLPAAGIGAENAKSSSSDPEKFLQLQTSVFYHTLVEAKDLPDIGILPKKGAIVVRTEIPRQQLTIDRRALPNINGTSFVLMTREEIQEKANRDDDPFTYIVIDSIEFKDAIASVRVGTDMAIPEGSGLGKLCCCKGLAIFKLQDGRWIFERWKEEICA